MVEPLYQSPSFDGVLPSLVFLQVFTCNIKAQAGRTDLVTHHVAEPPLCRGGSRPRASSGGTRPGHVCGARREDVSHRSADGGPGASLTAPFRVHEY